MNGNLYIIWAPSGGGKTSLVETLMVLDPYVRRSISHTTRQPRAGELNGREYYFVDHPTFDGMIQSGDFLEHAEVYGNHYGTSQRWIKETLAAGLDVFLTIDWQGGEQVRKFFPEIIGIYVLPPSLAILEQRLKDRRQDSPVEITKRLAEVQKDLSHLDEFDYVIINEDFTRAVIDLAAIVRTKRLQRDAQKERHQKLIQALKKGK
jgi:guanylate kinase